jgi:hypothetical protein
MIGILEIIEVLCDIDYSAIHKSLIDYEKKWRRRDYIRRALNFSKTSIALTVASQYLQLKLLPSFGYSSFPEHETNNNVNIETRIDTRLRPLDESQTVVGRRFERPLDSRGRSDHPPGGASSP